MQSLAALADPTRRRIVELLAESEQPAGAIAKRFLMTPPAVSQHLKVLRDAGLVTVRVDRQFRIHALAPEGFDELETWLARTRRAWTGRLDALERELRADRTNDQLRNQDERDLE